MFDRIELRLEQALIETLAALPLALRMLVIMRLKM